MNRNRAASAVIVAAVIGVVAVTWAGAPARKVTHATASGVVLNDDESVALDAPPAGVVEAWSTADAGLAVPAAVGPAVVATDPDGVRGLDPATGEEAWSYHREGTELCTVVGEGDRVAAVFRGPGGCGEVTGLSAIDGSYQATRRSLTTGDVTPVPAGRRVGVRSPGFVELWRGDLVRTVGFGDPISPVRPEAASYPECGIGDARASGDLLATVVACPDGNRLVLQASAPEKSDEPEVSGDVGVPDGTHVVAMTENGVVVRAGDRLVAYRPDVSRIRSWPAGVGPTTADPAAVRSMGRWSTWFTGDDVVVFETGSLREVARVPRAIGSPARWTDRLLVPVRGGLAVVDPADGAIDRTIPVSRPDGRVDVWLIGHTIVERRDGELTGLVAAPGAPAPGTPTPVPAAPLPAPVEGPRPTPQPPRLQSP